MEWSREQVITLIELYRERPVLWDQNLCDYKDKNKKHTAWCEIGEEMQLNAAEAKSKIRNITSQFYRECKKEKSGSGAEKKTKWFAFELLFFLRDKTTPNRSRESQVPEETLQLQNDDFLNQTVSNNTSVIPTAPPGLTTNPCPSSSTRPKKRRYNHMAEEAYEVMKNVRANIKTKDEFDVYGEYVASQLRKSTNLHDLALAKRQINDALFNLEMATCSRHSGTHHSTSSTPSDSTSGITQTSFPDQRQYFSTVNAPLLGNDISTFSENYEAPTPTTYNQPSKGTVNDDAFTEL